MPTDALPIIPTPAGQRWRDLRMRVLPVIMFLSLVAMLIFMWANVVQPVGMIGEVQPVQADVSSLTDGVLTDLSVNSFEPVVKDQVLGHVVAARNAQVEGEPKPQPLRSPIDGRVSTIWKRAGDKVVRGEPLVTIRSPTSDRVLGYIQQPVRMIPTTNDLVHIRARSQKRQITGARIVHVGKSLKPITPVTMLPPDQRAEPGLPVLVELPSHSRLLSGQFVDMTISPAGK